MASKDTQFKKGNTPWHKGTKGLVKAWNKDKEGVSKETHNKMSKAKMGNKNNLGKHWKVKDTSKFTGANGFKKGHKINVGSHRTEETKEKLRVRKLGELNPAWKDGVSFEPYSLEWTKTLRLAIRQRDSFICQKCGMSEEECLKEFKRVLSVNHIDFDKKNCNPDNLNTLCCKCNSEINGNREYWTDYFNKQKIKIYG